MHKPIDDDVPARIVVVVEIEVSEFDSAVVHTDVDTTAVVIIPHRGDVDVDARGASELARVQQIPLVAE